MCEPAVGTGNFVLASSKLDRKSLTELNAPAWKRARTCGQKPGRVHGRLSVKTIPAQAGLSRFRSPAGSRLRDWTPFSHGTVELQMLQRFQDFVGQIVLETPTSAMANDAPVSMPK